MSVCITKLPKVTFFAVREEYSKICILNSGSFSIRCMHPCQHMHDSMNGIVKKETQTLNFGGK